ncbi:MAG TPA: hypothetical protein VMB50_15785 [Myxococcales bacterium]|jgi:Flp pilus assembly pilin Flp|nr:hypothetical protein [Myxococcales bacterium]
MRNRSTQRSRRGQRGQAMVEYSLMFWLIGLIFIAGFYIGPGGAKIKTDNNTYSFDSSNSTIFGLLIESYQIYQDGYYFSLCAPLP